MRLAAKLYKMSHKSSEVPDLVQRTLSVLGAVLMAVSSVAEVRPQDLALHGKGSDLVDSLLRSVLNTHAEVEWRRGEMFMHMGELLEPDAAKFTSAILELQRTAEAPALQWCHEVLGMHDAKWVRDHSMTNGGARVGLVIVRDGNLGALTCVRENQVYAEA